MATLERLKVGQVVYSVEKRRLGHTLISRDAVFRVVIKDINPVKRAVFASWNSNPALWYYESQVKRWKIKEPQKKVKP